MGRRKCSLGGCEGLRLENKLGCCAEALPRHPAVSPHPHTGPWTPVTPWALHTAPPHTQSPPRSRLRPSWQETALHRGSGAQTPPSPADPCPARPPRPSARPCSRNSSGLSSQGSAWPGLSHCATGQPAARLSQLFPPRGIFPACFLEVQSGNREGRGRRLGPALQTAGQGRGGRRGGGQGVPRDKESSTSRAASPARAGRAAGP